MSRKRGFKKEHTFTSVIGDLLITKDRNYWQDRVHYQLS